MTASKIDPVPWSIGAGALTLAWYALPDLVRSRTARTVIKTGLLGGTTAAMVPLAPSHTPERPLGEVTAQKALVGAAVLAGSVAATVWGEKALFGFGERRRARGVRLAHTLPALAWGVVAAGATAAALRGHPASA